MHFLGSGVRSSPFGAALTAAWVNCVVVAAAAVCCGWTSDGNPSVFFVVLSVFLSPDSIFAWLSRTLSSSIKFVMNESVNPSESV